MYVHKHLNVMRENSKYIDGARISYVVLHYVYVYKYTYIYVILI